MSVYLRKTFTFPAGVVHNDNYRINFYTLVVDFATTTPNPTDQNVAIDRIQYWLDLIVTDCVFIDKNNSMTDAFVQTGQRVLEFPLSPVDHLIGYMLYSKLKSITEGNLEIIRTEISSLLGGDMCYMHTYNEELDIDDAPDWWYSSGPSWISTAGSQDSNVIALTRSITWEELDLLWEDERGPDQEYEIVFEPDFDNEIVFDNKKD